MRKTIMRAVLLAAITSALLVPAVLAQSGHHSTCKTHRCWHRVSVRRHLAFPKHHPERYGWGYKRRHLDSPTKAMLFRLRMCESTDDYQATNGSHWGAYQYSWGGTGSAGYRAGFRVRPDYASPAEQDVRTAEFYPSHRSEWTCKA